jgi:hypothetical protein
MQIVRALVAASSGLKFRSAGFFEAGVLTASTKQIEFIDRRAT